MPIAGEDNNLLLLWDCFYCAARHCDAPGTNHFHDAILFQHGEDGIHFLFIARDFKDQSYIEGKDITCGLVGNGDDVHYFPINRPLFATYMNYFPSPVGTTPIVGVVGGGTMPQTQGC